MTTPTERDAAARAYALNTMIVSTDTLFSLIERAYKAGAFWEAGSALPTPNRADYYVPNPAAASPGSVYNMDQGFAKSYDPGVSPIMDDGEVLLPIIHRNGDVPCHRTALYHRGRVDPSARGDLTKLRTYPLGRLVTPHDVPLCGSCGQHIDPYSTQDLDWREHFVQLPTKWKTDCRFGPAVPPSEPEADSLPLSGESLGRTPSEDTASADVQPPAQLEERLSEAEHIAATVRPEITRLHDLAITMFTDRERGEPDAVPPVG